MCNEINKKSKFVQMGKFCIQLIWREATSGKNSGFLLPCLLSTGIPLMIQTRQIIVLYLTRNANNREYKISKYIFKNIKTTKTA